MDGFLAYMCISVAWLYRERQNLLSPTNYTNSAIMMLVLWVTFHAFNFLLFDIGVFPMMMLSCLCLFFDTEKRSSGKGVDIRISLSRSCRLLIILYFLVQLLMPVRFLLYNTSQGRHVNWTGHGEMFSWRMMLTSKRCAGHFELESKDSMTILRDPSDFGLNQMQWWRMISDVEHVRTISRRSIYTHSYTHSYMEHRYVRWHTTFVMRTVTSNPCMRI